MRYLLLIFLTYAIRVNMSGYIWYCQYLLCPLGFGLVFQHLKGEEEMVISS